MCYDISFATRYELITQYIPDLIVDPQIALDYDMNLQQAIDAPRIHHQWMPDVVRWEPFEFSKDTWDALVSMGHVLGRVPGTSDDGTYPYIGDAHGIMIDPKDGMRLGASDPRRGGEAVGY